MYKQYTHILDIKVCDGITFRKSMCASKRVKGSAVCVEGQIDSVYYYFAKINYWAKPLSSNGQFSNYIICISLYKLALRHKPSVCKNKTFDQEIKPRITCVWVTRHVYIYNLQIKTMYRMITMCNLLKENNCYFWSLRE